MVIESSVCTKFHGKLKPLHLHYHINAIKFDRMGSYLTLWPRPMQLYKPLLTSPWSSAELPSDTFVQFLFMLVCNAKSFAIAILAFFLFFLLVTIFGLIDRSYFKNFLQLLLSCCFLQLLPYPLEINSNNRLKRDHLESSSSASKSIASPLPQCLWPPSLVEWWFTLRGSYRPTHINLWSSGL